MVLLSEQSIKSLRKADLVEYTIELTKHANRIKPNDTYEFVKNPKAIVEVKKEFVGKTENVQVTITDNETPATYNIVAKIINSKQVKLSTAGMSEIINVDNPLAVMINEKGLTKPLVIYLVTTKINLGDKPCFNLQK